MKKNELAKKSRKLFSAILAGAMLTTSAIPESFVWAAEDVQGFGDGEDNEDVIFESVEEFVAEDAVEEDFTDGVALFSSGSERAGVSAAAKSI